MKNYLTHEPATVDAVAELLGELQVDAESHGPRYREDGLACSNRLGIAITSDIRARLACGNFFADPEFLTTLDVQLAVRYLRAVNDHGLGAAVPRSWGVLLDRRGATLVTPLQFALAGANAMVNYDLAFALVSTCTVLGRSLGPVERHDYDAFTGLVADQLRELARSDRGVPDESADVVNGLATIVSRDAAWRRAVQLWSLRGRPAETAAERVAVDWQASMIGRAMLAREPI